MNDIVTITIKCPCCKQPLTKMKYRTPNNWHTWTRIKCDNKACKVDTGERATMSDAYEALMYLHFGAESTKEYIRPLEHNTPDEYR